MGTMKLKLFGLAALVAAVYAAVPGISAQEPAVEEFTAFAINVNRRMTGGPAANRPTTATLIFRIERWSTDEQRDSLLSILKEEQNVNRANQSLLRALQRMPRVGWIREATTTSWDLRYAQQTPLPDGGRRIMIGTDRRMPFWEVRNRPRSSDYPFTVFEIRLDKDNRGEGKLLADTRLSFNRDTNTLVLENYDISPVRLNQIRRTN